MRHYFFYIIIIIASVYLNCIPGSDKKYSSAIRDSIYIGNVPPQPGEESWKFIDDLKSPMWTRHDWSHKNPGALVADLSEGVMVEQRFPDEAGRLETAYEDLRQFLKAGGVNYEKGKYLIRTENDSQLWGESFRLDIDTEHCIISVGDAEGIRRGIFYLEDEMLRQHGPYLTPGKVEKHPFILRRISRCFFGPIKRPPKLRDELMDDIDYYPDQYLNRLAHEGINGLWLTVELGILSQLRIPRRKVKMLKKGWTN